MDTVVVTTVLVVSFVGFAASLVYAVIYVMNFMRDTQKRLDAIVENTQTLLDRTEGMGQ